MTGERQAAGGFRVAVVAVADQAVDVVGQAGGGAHGVVPQDVDHVVQPVQAILHLRLQKSKAESELMVRLLRWENWRAGQSPPPRTTASLALIPGEVC